MNGREVTNVFWVMMGTMNRLVGAALLAAIVGLSCEGSQDPPAVSDFRTAPTISSLPATVPSSPPPASPSPQAAAPNRWVTERPSWLGQRILPPGIDGFGQVRPTPKILRNRRFATIDLFPAPVSRRFRASVAEVPRRVAARSSWRSECPVTLDQLAYIKMTFWGFDRLPHIGEMLVHESVASEVVNAFERIYRARFPIEEMRVVTLKEVREWHEKPTGDTNVTSSFECRPATQGTSWSMHAYGLAIDINPFHNPYLSGALVAPELASAYVNRDWRRPGMIHEGDAVTQAFDAIGWGWGGRWSSRLDWMHFSQNGR